MNRSEETNTEAVAAGRGVEPVTVGDLAVVSIAVPTTTPADAEGRIVGIEAPLEDVATHIIQPIAIRFLLSNTMCLASTITGSSVTRAGGGGGMSYNNTIATGGSGGGGDGGRYTSANATSGTVNTGGGGGGGSGYNETAGAGGSGVVILRYPSTYSISVGGGLTSSTTTVGSDKVTTFTAGTDIISFS